MNFVHQYKGKKVIYDIEMTSPTASQSIRDSYGLFWRKKSGRRLPDELRGISFSNAFTFPTCVRIRVLKELCRRHQLANPTLSCFVTSYLARPELKICDRRGLVTSLTYVEAVQQLSQHLTHDFLKELFIFAKTNLPEREVFERFLVLTPDLLTDNLAEPMSIDPPPDVHHEAEPTSTNPPVSVGPSALLQAVSINTAPAQISLPIASGSSSSPLTPVTNTSPTYATLTNVVLTPPPPLTPHSGLMPSPLLRSRSVMAQLATANLLSSKNAIEVDLLRSQLLIEFLLLPL
jgi:hypothetical protein